MRVDRDGHSIANARTRVYWLETPNPWGERLLGTVVWQWREHTFEFFPKGDLRTPMSCLLTFTKVPGMPKIQRCEQLVKAKPKEIV